MKNLIPFMLLSIFFLTSCRDKSAPTAIEGDKMFFGDKITASGAISYDELLTKLETSKTVENIKVKGKIGGVCQAKGCWMNIASEIDPSKETIVVKFKDYGFFVPLDASGRTATMTGRAYKEETSVDELRHYAEDEGQTPEQIAAITKPVTELKFMADGVIIE